MTPNEQLATALPVVRKKIARAHFLHEHWVVLNLGDAELISDAAEEYSRDLEMPEPTP